MCTVWSYTKYDGNLQDLCTMVIEVSSFFILLQKMKTVYRIFLFHGVHLSHLFCYYICVT